MAKLEVKRMRLYFLQNDSRALLAKLQKLGAVELTAFKDERMSSMSAKSSIAAIERNLRVAEECLEAMNKYRPPKGGIGSMFSGRTEIDSDEYARVSDSADEVLKLASSVVSEYRSIGEMRGEIRKCEMGLEMLSLWNGLDVPMQRQKTDSSTVFIGTFPEELSEAAITEALLVAAPDAAFDVSLIGSGAGQSAVCIIVYDKDAEELWSVLRTMGFTKPADPTKHTPDVRHKRLLDKIEALTADISAAEKKIVDSVSHRTEVRYLTDYLTARRDEYAEIEKLGVGDSIMVAEGYVVEAAIPEVESMLAPYTAAAEFYEPAEDEDVPVVLQNSSFNQPMEAVVEMYSMPSKRDIDPSSVIAFFYYLLFGMMLSDAGYGILMTVFTAIVLKKTTVEGSLRRSLKMFMWGGISTTIWGLLFGSFFGDIIPVICTEFLGYAEPPSIALWFEPLTDSITLLVFSLGLGICHLLLGLITATVIKCREGDLPGGILDNVPIMLLLIGAAPLGGSVFISVPTGLMYAGAVIAVIGIIGIVLFSSRASKSIIGRIGGGLYALYNNVSGYLSDILSYSRLLALGLATGSIAGVINMMGTLPDGKVAKAILLTVVFILGHALNMAINILGAYVHTIRLQFVELFPKFYEGGGRAMKPFAMNTKYFKLRKEARADESSPSDG